MSDSETNKYLPFEKYEDALNVLIKAVTIQDTGDPKLMQIGVYENGIWTNISLGITTPEEKYHPNFSNGLLMAETEYKSIEKLTTETSVVNGQNTVVFTTEENLKAPIITGKESKNDQQMYGSAIKYYFHTRKL